MGCGSVIVWHGWYSHQLCHVCSWPVPLIGGWVGVFVRSARERVFVVSVCCFDVVETSYEGHMVDALASRADEGRWSLR